MKNNQNDQRGQQSDNNSNTQSKQNFGKKETDPGNPSVKQSDSS